jgi:hypothetical protein
VSREALARRGRRRLWRRQITPQGLGLLCGPLDEGIDCLAAALNRAKVNGAGSSQCDAITAHGSHKSLIYLKSFFSRQEMAPDFGT